MICCIGGQGEALDLMQDCRRISFWGLVCFYGALSLERATLALVGWALRAMGLHHSRYYFMDPQQCSLIAPIPPLGWGWCTWFTMSSRLHICTIHLADVPRSIGLFPAVEAGLTSSFQPLQMIYRHFQSTWIPMRISLCPSHPLGGITGICLENKGPTPCPLCLRSILKSCHTLYFIRASSKAQQLTLLIILPSWEAYYYVIELSWSDCHQGMLLLHIIIWSSIRPN